MLSRDATLRSRTDADSESDASESDASGPDDGPDDGSDVVSRIDLDERVASIEDSTLRSIVRSAVEDHAGIGDEDAEGREG